MVQLDDKLYSKIVAGLMTFIGIVFFFSRSNGLISTGYYDAFYPITVFLILFVWVVVWLENNSGTDNVFFFNQKSKFFPIFNNLGAKLGLAVFLSFIFSVGTASLGIQFIDIPQPFTEVGFSQATQLDKFYFQAVHPGFVEELGIFLAGCVLLFILVNLLGNVIRNPKLNFIVSVVITASAQALVLTQAHRIVYGSDATAYFGIFLFEFLVQGANLITGMFISWIPHMAHNAVVVFSTAVGFSVGGTALYNYFITRREKNGRI